MQPLNEQENQLYPGMAIEEALNSSLSPTDKWTRLLPELKNLSSPTAIANLYQRCFSEWNRTALGPAPMWIPNQESQSHSNLGQWMQEKQIPSFQEFHSWSVQNRNDFWLEAIDRLGIDFKTKPQAIVADLSEIESPTWLPGATMNIAASCFQASPQGTAIVFQRADKVASSSLEKWTYEVLETKTKEIASSIRACGYQPGDALAVVLPMTAESVAIYLGIVWAGCIVVSIADSFAPKEIQNRLRIANAKGVFTYDHVLRAGKSLSMLTRVIESTELPIVVLGSNEEPPSVNRSQDLTWCDFLAKGQGGNDELHIAAPNDAINILFSSGTTGDPKAIPWTHTTPIKCAIDGYCHQDIQPGHVTCWPTNLGWMMGPFLIFATLINRGTIALFEDAPVGPAFGRFVQDASVNMLGVIPTIVQNWRATGDMETFDWTAINVFSSTGESSQPDDMVYLSALAKMRPVIEYCGGTEIGGGYITSTVLEPNIPSAFSTAAVGIEFDLLDGQGNSTDEGEVFLVPPSIGLSTRLLNRDHHETYFAGTPTRSDAVPLRRHGDFMRRLPNGYFVAGGRVDDTMNLGGIKVSSAELERVMNQTEGVVETAAIAIAAAGGPEELHVFVVQRGTSTAAFLTTAFNQQLRNELNPLFKVKTVHIVDSLPRTASNKVMRRKLRDSVKSST